MRALALAAALLASAPVAANIDTTDSSNFNQFPFGSPDTATYGQTFQPGPGDGTLTSFSLYLRGRPSDRPGTGPLDLRGYLAAWDGTRSTGPLLFASPTVTKADGPALQEFAFDLSVPVVAGQSYVAFLSVSGLATQPRSRFGTPLTFAGDSLDGGQFVFLNNGLNFAALFSDNWLSLGRDDIFFKAGFAPRTVESGVPEPGTWALMIVGLAATGLSLRYRNRRKTLQFATSISAFS